MFPFFFKGYTPAQLGNHPLAHQRSGSDGGWILSILMTLQLQHILVINIVYKHSLAINYMYTQPKYVVTVWSKVIVILYLQYTEIISTHVPNLIDELSSAKERRLNQFGTTVLIWCGKHRLVRQGLPHYATLEQQLIQTPLLCAEPNA